MAKKIKYENHHNVMEHIKQKYLKGYLDARLDMVGAKTKRRKRKTPYPIGFEYAKERK